MKTRFGKAAVCAVATAAVLALMAGCSGSAGNTGASASGEGFAPSLDTTKEATVNVVGDFSNFEALEAQFEKFNQVYPNVTLTYTKVDDYNNNVYQALNAKDEAPDLFMSAPYTFTNPDFSDAASMAEDLTAAGVDASAVKSEILYTEEGKGLQVLPILGETYGMVVNQDLLAKYNLSVPTTYSELMDCCKVLQENGIESPIQGCDSASGLYTNFAFNHLAATLSADASALGKIANGESGAGEALRSHLQEVADLMDSGYVSHDANKASEDGYENQILAFFEGDVPFMLMNTTTVSGMAKRESMSEAFQANPFTYAFYEVPCSDSGAYGYRTFTRGISLNKNAPNKDYATEFLRFLAQTTSLDELAAAKKVPSVTGNVDESGAFASLANTSADHTCYTLDNTLNDKQMTAVKTALYSVGMGMSVDDAIAAFEKDLSAA